MESQPVRAAQHGGSESEKCRMLSHPGGNTVWQFPRRIHWRKVNAFAPEASSVTSILSTRLPLTTIMRNLNSAAFVCLSLTISAGIADEVDFNRDVRPILSDACFACHGPDSGPRQADLRLDQQEGIFRNVDGTTVVDPASSDNSELLKRVLSDDPDFMMPPPAGARALTAEEKRTIQQWIGQGAPWKGHWAYIAPVKPPVPEVAVSPTGNEIDRFIQQQLNTKQFSPLAQADPVTLVRRLFMDLTGLPPTAQQVAVFQTDPSAEKWNAVINELLASHRYAERMTALWLDLVRYADTNGIHGDNHREVWMYRDYVIDAFHRNMPFSQFTIEQLAGDLLPNATDEQKIASGYNRLLMTTREGGAQAKEYLARYSADRVRNASSVWMGATMGCCECHDHKFDPYSIRDFLSVCRLLRRHSGRSQWEFSLLSGCPRWLRKNRRRLWTGQAAELQKALDTQTPELDTAHEHLGDWICRQN